MKNAMGTRSIQEALTGPLPQDPIQLRGWVQNRRIGKNMTFITLQDGSTQKPMQVVVETRALSEELIKALHVGASLVVVGQLVASQGRGQTREVQAQDIQLLGACSADYPLQPKAHSLAFLRTLQHLRFRTSTFRAIFRMRHEVSWAIHQFFHQRGFCWIHTPLITDVDTEGAGETFGVVAHHESGDPFFGGPAHLTVSGQLALEPAAMGLGKVYTFGPTFRAENSHTTRHLAEFWMVEPEIAFYDLPDTLQLAEDFLKFVIAHVLTACPEELQFLADKKEEGSTPAEGGTATLQERLKALISKPFVRMTYTEALQLLEKEAQKNPKRFVYPVAPWGVALQKEHETFLTDHFEGAVIVTDYPARQKPFYMRQNEDGKTVAAMDILFPQIGEIIGGSQREERYDRLYSALQQQGLEQSKMDWYLDTRRFGSVPHSGFGLGLERLVQFVTGMENIRDVTPYPRTPGQIRY